MEPGFRLLPRDHPDRALRLRRLLMAVYSYLLMWGGLAIGTRLGAVAPDLPHLPLLLILLAINAVFFVMIRSGYSERFKDPSLTVAQMLVGIAVITLILHYARELRGALLCLYLMLMTFGVFSIHRRRQIAMALVAQSAFTLLLIYEWLLLPGQRQFTLMFSHWGILALTLTWFVSMGGHIQSLQQRFRAQRESLLQAHDRLARIAVRDELTGLYNRRHFLERFDEELSRVSREPAPLYLALVDLDHFKPVNDTYGHQAGDAVLQRFANVASHCLRRTDVLARYGGEEFAILFPRSHHEACLAAITRLRERFAEARYAFAPDLRVTLSCGLAAYQPGDTARTLLERADQALYRAKSEGRNRVSMDPIRE
ncbi:GGDEF domain-containing protein [Alloalcanivorax xenomutans]|uniref:GGDEF domain-containing protein n=1 Tax=Alloalcanivorax xenomutans TaxID=1094342 RepID=UPI003A8126C7